jgi:hypothetical protein
MVRRAERFHVAALTATVLAALALTGCMQAVNSGLSLLGLGGDHPKAGSVGADRPAPARPATDAPLGRAAGDHPRSVTSTYEHAPAFGWERYARGPNASPVRFLSEKIGQESCFLTSPGLSRVLSIQDGAPVRPVWQAGFVTVGVAGPGTDALFDLWAMNTLGLAQDAMQRTARAATFGGCNRSLFLFVSLGTGGSYTPVVVR